LGEDAAPTLSMEDVVGLNVLDCSMRKMQNQLVINRDNSWSASSISSSNTQNQNQIFKLSHKHCQKREMASIAYARTVTEILLNQVNNETMNEMSFPNYVTPVFDKFLDEKQDDKNDMIDESDDEKKDDEKDKEEEEEEEQPTSLKGYVICISGSLSKTKSQIESLIKKNGGKFAPNITAATTHLICEDVNGSSSKISKAKEKGIKIVSEKFLTNFL